MRTISILMAALAVAILLHARTSFADDECLVEFRDANGAVSDGSTITQTASNHACQFDLKLCVDVPSAACSPSAFQKKKFRASGHCGPVGKLQVVPSGSSSACGAFTGIKVKTKKNGRKKGQCKLRVEARTASSGARTDLDKLTLVCEP